MSLFRNSFQLSKCCLSVSRVPQITFLTNQLMLRLSISNRSNNELNSTKVYHARQFVTTGSRLGLEEFIDEKENWTENKVLVGRPWHLDELRLKCSTDLHKLWYVLLKERNMLLTMDQLYNDEFEVMPNPERIFKVEESMENILAVVKERDTAYNLLETGETGEPPIITCRNFLGLKYKRRAKEYGIPKLENRIFNLLHPSYDRRLLKFVRRYKEQLWKRQRRHKQQAQRYKSRLLAEFPHLHDNEQFMEQDPEDMYPVKFNPEIYDDVDEDYYEN